MKTKFVNNIIEGYFIAVISVAFATCGLWLFRDMLGKAHIGLVYLLVVASVAGIAGTRPALFTAILSFLLWNFFFIHPIFTFTIHDPRDWILLCVFLIIGIMVGQITGRVRTREEEAIAREKDTNALYNAIVSINSQIGWEKILREMVDQVLINTGARGCAIIRNNENRLGIISRAGDVKRLEEEETILIAINAIKNGKAVGLIPQPDISPDEGYLWPVSVKHGEIIEKDISRNDVFLPMSAGEKSMGLMYAIPYEGNSFSLSHSRLLVAFANNAATLLERQRLMEETSQAVAFREGERMKSVLFSSISHNLKTPLASLNATLTSLRQKDILWDHKTLEEQFDFMAEDVNRLTENIDKLLDLAQLESGNWQPREEWFELREVISTAIRHLTEEQYKRLKINLPEELPMVWLDSVQFSQVIRHLVENALSYSSFNIEINAISNNDEIELCVDDEGKGISDTEKEHIFRKFYRGQAAKEQSVRGTGLGLAICHEIVYAHKGKIFVEKSPQGGARFRICLPTGNDEKKVIHNE